MSTISIDVEVCPHCGETFKEDSENTFVCGECGKTWCSEECAVADGLLINYDRDPYQYGYDCNFCREDDFEDKELFDFVTSAIGVSRDNLVAFYKEFKDQLKKGNICKSSGQINFSSFSKTGDAVVTGAILTGTTLGTRTNKKGDVHE